MESWRAPKIQINVHVYEMCWGMGIYISTSLHIALCTHVNTHTHTYTPNVHM